MVASRSRTSRSCPARRKETRRRQLLSRCPRRPTWRSWIASLPERSEKKAATGFFTVIRRGVESQMSVQPYSVEYQDELVRAAALLREAAALADGANAEGIPVEARRRVSLERLLRQRHRLDGAEGRDRADDRALRSVRRRVLQLQSRVRGLHHHSRRRGEREAAEIRRRAAGHREPPADRSEIPQSEDRCARSDRRGERGVHARATRTVACRRRRTTCRTTTR